VVALEPGKLAHSHALTTIRKEGRRVVHLGLMMECDYRQDRTQREAFAEAFALAEMAEQETLGLSGFIMESNVGGRIPLESVLESIRLLGQEVAPELRA